MKLARLSIVAVFAAISIAPGQAVADATSASVITCSPTRGARCKSDKCEWRDASKHDKGNVLELDFKLMEAVMISKNKRRKMGKIIKVDTRDGKRDVIVSRSGKDDPAQNFVMMIVKGGKFSGWRANKRVRFEGMCKPA